MSEFDETIKTKLQELTSQLTEKDRHMSQIQKNLDSSYQDELSKEKKKQRKELLIKKQEEDRENQGNNFFDLPLNSVYINFINTFSNIFSDLLSLTKKEIPNSNSESQIYTVIYFYIQEIFYIFFQVPRLIYVGIAFIISSFFVFFILATK
tara:strand:- start:432 stop:884 length:453 start_codon:yes stop_codon:yes gene_type:complete